MENSNKEVNHLKAATQIRPETRPVRIQDNVLEVLNDFLKSKTQLVSLTQTQFISQAIIEKIERDKKQAADYRKSA